MPSIKVSHYVSISHALVLKEKPWNKNGTRTRVKYTRYGLVWGSSRGLVSQTACAEKLLDFTYLW